MSLDKISFRVRYGETDQMGVVYHGNYAQYLEMGRIEWLRRRGISYKKLEASGILLPVISLNLKFLHSACYDDILTVSTTLVKLPQVKIEFDYEIHNQEGVLLCRAKTTLAFMDAKKNRPVACPESVLAVI